MLTRDELLEILSFDESIARFRWKRIEGDDAKTKRFNAKYAGRIAGSATAHGALVYVTVKIKKKPYREHRLVWLYYAGELPTEPIDHIDGDGLNNRFENLRLAVGGLNTRNQALSKRNTSGYCGVFTVKGDKGYKVEVGGRYGGFFKKEDLHLAAAKAAEMHALLGYSPTHGKRREERVTKDENGLPISAASHVPEERETAAPKQRGPRPAEEYAPTKHNSSGHRWVYWNKAKKKYVVKVNHDGKYYFGGYFRAEDLQRAVQKAHELRDALVFGNQTDAQ